MQKVFEEVNSLDKKCYEEFFMSEDLLMEHAANAMADFIKKKFEKNSKVLIVCGTGNNGADGIALGRLLYKDYDITIYLPFGTKSNMGRMQIKRASLIGVEIIEDKSHKLPLHSYDVVVDALFGSGLKRPLLDECVQIIQTLNKYENSYKIACDIPSGIVNPSSLQVSNYEAIFKADTTITMGALKYQLFGDLVKDFVGDIIVADLGLSRKLYEDDKSDYMLLDKEDLVLPFRKTNSSHKGNFGHLCVIAGQKVGAASLCCEAGFIFGAGLVTAVSSNLLFPYHIMTCDTIPDNTTAMAVGMGLGEINEELLDEIFIKDVPIVVDADLFYNEYILKIMHKENLVFTPHPKEFCSLLKICDIADIDVPTLQNNRFKFVKKFIEKYPNITLLLKGANTLICKEDKIYINSFGTSVLSQGGSGDVLSGLIASLLAQGNDTLASTINASLAMCLAGQNYTKNNYSMKPQDLIEEVKKL